MSASIGQHPPPPPPLAADDGDEERLRRKSSHDERMDRLAEALGRIKKINRDDKASKIVDGIYIGSVAAANNKERLKNEGITHVLCVAHNIQPRHPEDFEYLTVEVTDTADADIRQHFEKCFGFIHKALCPGSKGEPTTDSKVLVHCFAGVSRSATVVIAYLMATRGLDLNKALEIVEKGRSQVDPNVGFRLQLKKYEKEGPPKWP